MRNIKIYFNPGTTQNEIQLVFPSAEIKSDNFGELFIIVPEKIQQEAYAGRPHSGYFKIVNKTELLGISNKPIVFGWIFLVLALILFCCSFRHIQELGLYYNTKTTTVMNIPTVISSCCCTLISAICFSVRYLEERIAKILEKL